MGACTTIRVAIIADTHGFIDPRIAEAVRACDVAVHAGDIGNAEVLHTLQRPATVARDARRRPRVPRVSPPRSPDTLPPSQRMPGHRRNTASLAGSPAARAPRLGKWPLIAVRGNNDTAKHWGANANNMLAALPEEAALDLPGGALVVVHGHRAGAVAGRHARLRHVYPQARVVAYGHSHRLVCDQSQYPWILNPGAAGRARTYGGPSCLVLHAGSGQWRVEAIRFAN